MAIELLSHEYKKHREVLRDLSFNKEMSDLALLKLVLGPFGPQREHASQLVRFRARLLKGDEATALLAVAGFASDGKGVPDAKRVKLVASLKFLRHLYLVSERGSQQVWVLSIPKTYTHFPFEELWTVKANYVLLKAKLAETDEQFPNLIRERFGSAMMLALAWAEAAKIVLAAAHSNTKAMEKVRRWFADANTTRAMLDRTIGELLTGFKKISTALNMNQVLITDMPSLRNDPAWALTEAFIASTSSGPERPRTIYVEKAMFENYQASVLHDMKKNWARILIHECSHLEARTEDVGYAFDGIRPGSDISAAEAAINADSWAFFAADCANALTAGDLMRAFGGTGDPLTKLPHNWN